MGKKIYYQNVYLFVERVRDLTLIKRDTLVKTNLNTTLQGAAQSWYTAELSKLEQSSLRSFPNGVEEWCFFLIARFKEPSKVALTKLTSEKYTSKDARNRRKPASYVQTIVRHAKATNINKTLNQLTFAHKGIAPELKVFVNPPNKSTSISSFIKTLELKKSA